MIDSFQCKLTSYSQIDEIIARLSDYPSDLQADIGHAGEYFSKLVDISDFEAAKKKKVCFLCAQMILTAKRTGFAVLVIFDMMSLSAAMP